LEGDFQVSPPVQ